MGRDLTNNPSMMREKLKMSSDGITPGQRYYVYGGPAETPLEEIPDHHIEWCLGDEKKEKLASDHFPTWRELHGQIVVVLKEEEGGWPGSWRVCSETTGAELIFAEWILHPVNEKAAPKTKKCDCGGLPC